MTTEDLATSLVSVLEGRDRVAGEKAKDELARLGRDAVPALREHMARKKEHRAAHEVLRRMGYPANAEAIPELVEDLMYPDAYPPTYTTALEVLQSIGVRASDSLRAVLVQQAHDPFRTKGVAELLSTFKRAEIAAFTPELLGVVQKGFCTDPESCIWVIELLGRVGSPEANSAIPVLCDCYRFILDWMPAAPPKYDASEWEANIKSANSDVRRAVLEALAGFNPLALVNAVATIELATSDPDDEALRAEASTLLERVRKGQAQLMERDSSAPRGQIYRNTLR
jgi:hypothetical protein